MYSVYLKNNKVLHINENSFYIKFIKFSYENEILSHLSKSITKGIIVEDFLTKYDLLNYVFQKCATFRREKFCIFTVT